MQRRVSPRLLQREREVQRFEMQNNILSNPIADYVHAAEPMACSRQASYPAFALQPYMAPLEYPAYQYPQQNSFQQLPPIQHVYQPYFTQEQLSAPPHAAQQSPIESTTENDEDALDGTPDAQIDANPFQRNVDYVEGEVVDGKKTRRKRSFSPLFPAIQPLLFLPADVPLSTEPRRMRHPSIGLRERLVAQSVAIFGWKR